MDTIGEAETQRARIFEGVDQARAEALFKRLCDVEINPATTQADQAWVTALMLASFIFERPDVPEDEAIAEVMAAIRFGIEDLKRKSAMLPSAATH